MAQAFRLAHGGRIDRSRPIALQLQRPGHRAPTPATRSPRRCSPTASTSSAGRSSITARAASSLTAAEEPNALVSVDRGARPRRPQHPRRRASRRSTACRSPRRTAGRRSASTSAPSTTCCRRSSPPASTTRPSCGRAPSGTGSTSPRSAPPRASAARPPAPIPTAISTATPTATCWSSAPAPPASLPRSPLGERQARHRVRRAGRAGRLAAARRTSAIDGKAAWDWLAETLAALGGPRQRHAAAAHDRLRLLQPQSHRRCCSASPTISATRTPTCRASACGRCARREVVLATGALERPLVFPDNDRPGIMLAESLRVLRQPLRRGAGPRGRHRHLAALPPTRRRRSAGGRARGRASSICAGERLRAGGRGCARRRLRGPDRAHGRRIAWRATRVAGLIVAPVDASGAVGATRTLDCDCVGMSGGWTPAVHLFSQSRGKLASTRRLDAFVPGASAQAERSRRRLPRAPIELARCLAARAGARGGSARRGSRRERTFAAERDANGLPAGPHPARLRRRGGAAAPSSISRTT